MICQDETCIQHYQGFYTGVDLIPDAIEKDGSPKQCDCGVSKFSSHVFYPCCEINHEMYILHRILKPQNMNLQEYVWEAISQPMGGSIVFTFIIVFLFICCHNMLSSYNFRNNLQMLIIPWEKLP